jgi:peptide deformylase
MQDEARTLDVIRLGHPVLRSVAEEVPESLFASGRLDRLGRDLVQTMLHENGVGLAAPQVAEELRLFAYWLPTNEDGVAVEPTVLANPTLRVVDSEIEEGWEGCLSIPGLRGLVPRPRRIKVKARRTDGRPVSFTAEGFHARVIQHEFDHLDGVVFLDRMTSPHSLAFEEEWQQYVVAEIED